eukprot:GDKJ01037317.1.p1 GENE.GDKJ01037317.1~~GDKJ01037317.1.p1  ORF type:complete len:488 (-),score=106.94 GDKJ01037317.1:51-1514(-)
MRRVFPSIKSYEWGQKGEVSLVNYLKSHGSSLSNDFEKPFAELWLGSHSSGPSPVDSVDSPETISNLLKKDPVMSAGLVDGDLPFLMKILSIESPLSIQAHPCLTLAKELHSKFPNLYPDSNHKPEVAVALTPFEAMCGFREMSDIYDILISFEESHIAYGSNYSSILKKSATLKEMVSTFLTADPTKVVESLSLLVNRLSSPDFSAPNSVVKSAAELIVRLHNSYPGDVGCFMACILNHVVLLPGEALFIPALVPHAYIFGDCMESMACSDNVIRGGLTPKAKHVEVLVEQLDYTAVGEKSTIIINPKCEGDFISYIPPIAEFKMIFQFVRQLSSSSSPVSTLGPAIGIVLQGRGIVSSSKSEDDSQSSCTVDSYKVGDCFITAPHHTFTFSPSNHGQADGENNRVIIPYLAQSPDIKENVYMKHPVVSNGGLNVLRHMRRVERFVSAKICSKEVQNMSCGWSMIEKQDTIDSVVAWTCVNDEKVF